MATKKKAVKKEEKTEMPQETAPAYGGFNMDESTAKVKKALKIVIGLIVMVAGVYAIAHWFGAFLQVLKGSIGVIVILIGLLVLFLGISD